METAIFIFYLLLFSWLLIVIPFYKNAGIGKWWLICFFWLKILAAFAYAWFYKLPKYYPGADTWRFFRLSIPEKKWLMKDPVAFFADLFHHGYAQPGNIFSGENSYWNDLKSNIIVKLLAMMNVFTNDSYYTNIIFFNFIFLVGLVCLFKVFIHIFPQRKTAILAGIFLLPSTLFWCSGIHKDGLILSILGVIVFQCYRFIITGKSTFKKIIITGFCFLIIFFLRNYIIIALIPALACWYFSEKKNRYTVWIFSLTYLVGIILFFLIGTIYPAADLPAFIVQKQQEFLQLEGGSIINVKALKPSFNSFAGFMPTAIDMAFFRPHVTEITNPAVLPAFFEICLLWLLVVAAMFYHNKKSIVTPFNWFCIFFSVTILLLAGYTITFTGAIVRYRSIVLPFFFTMLLCKLTVPFKLNKIKYFNKS